jgi:hypothetical protein
MFTHTHTHTQIRFLKGIRIHELVNWFMKSRQKIKSVVIVLENATTDSWLWLAYESGSLLKERQNQIIRAEKQEWSSHTIRWKGTK